MPTGEATNPLSRLIDHTYITPIFIQYSYLFFLFSFFYIFQYHPDPVQWCICMHDKKQCDDLMRVYQSFMSFISFGFKRLGVK